MSRGERVGGEFALTDAERAQLPGWRTGSRRGRRCGRR